MQMVLSFELPFALIPLLKFCNSSNKVGPLKESIYVRKPFVFQSPLISDKEYIRISDDPSSRSQVYMESMGSCMQTVVIAWVLSFALIVVNTYFLVWTYVDWLVSHRSHGGRLPKYATALVSVVVFALMAAYLVFVVYLTFRRDTVRTYVPVSERAQAQAEDGSSGAKAVADDSDQPAPFRKDLADAST